MEQSFADLLTDAFSETSVVSFADGDLDFENLNFDDNFEDKTDVSQENLTKEDVALHQEATGQTADCQTLLSHMDAKDKWMPESVDKEQSDDEDDKEDLQGEGVMSVDKAPEEDYTSSDGSVSGEDDEDEEEEEEMGTGEKSGDLSMSVRRGDELCDDDKEDRIFAEGQPVAPEGAENPQVRNEEQGERDEEVRYFERVPERGSEMMIKGDGIEEDEQERKEDKQEDLSDSESDGMKLEQDRNVLARCFEQEVDGPCRDGPAKASLEFPEISKQNLQDLVAEVDGEECEGKMKDFSEEEHQEAGESIADYPSDFSSCEYVDDRRQTQESKPQPHNLACTADSGSAGQKNACLERAATDATWTGGVEETVEEGDEYLYSRDLEVDVEFRSLNVGTGENDVDERRVSGDAAVTGSDDGAETSESESYSSSDDDARGRMSDEEHLHRRYLENRETQYEGGGGAARWSTSDSREDPADLHINWNLDVLTTDTRLCEDLLTTEDSDKAETLLSDVTHRSAGDVNSYLDVQRQNSNRSYQGSVDDSFFFNTELEASGITELGQLGDDEYEEERNWEQEQERIRAFYEFYHDSDGEDGREGRQIKVQFCADPLSQVIHYETDSSDRDSLSSSTDGEELQSSTDTSEELREPDDATQTTPACDPPNTQPPDVPDVSNTPVHTRKHKCLGMLKLMLKMSVVVLMGLLMFWLATDQDWFSQASLF